MPVQHVCLIGPIPPPWGGVQTHMMSLRDHLRSRGRRCSIINYTRHREPDRDDLYYPQGAKQALLRIHALHPDIVHVHLGGNLFPRDAALFALLSARPRTANVLTFHSGGYPSSEEGKRARPLSLRGLALQQLDAVVGVNQALVDVFQKYGVKKERAHLIEPFAPGLDRDAVLSETLSERLADFFASHNPVLLAVGLLEREYGLDVQLAAFGSIRARFPNAGLLFIGSGTLQDTLRQAIDAHQEREHIMLGGDVPRPQTLAAIARANVLLRTTHFDGDAISVREALELGTTVVATDNGMRPEGVRMLRNLTAESLIEAIPAALDESAKPALRGVTNTANPMDTLLSLYDFLGQRSAG